MFVPEDFGVLMVFLRVFLRMQTWWVDFVERREVCVMLGFAREFGSLVSVFLCFCWVRSHILGL